MAQSPSSSQPTCRGLMIRKPRFQANQSAPRKPPVPTVTNRSSRGCGGESSEFIGAFYSTRLEVHSSESPGGAGSSAVVGGMIRLDRDEQPFARCGDFAFRDEH